MFTLICYDFPSYLFFLLMQYAYNCSLIIYLDGIMCLNVSLLLFSYYRELIQYLEF